MRPHYAATDDDGRPITARERPGHWPAIGTLSWELGSEKLVFTRTSRDPTLGVDPAEEPPMRNHDTAASNSGCATKLAALDLGSNSFHVLVAELHTSGVIAKLHSQKDVLRLGSIVHERGQLSEQALDAAFASVRGLTRAARERGAEKVLAVATSALRDARNGPTFCQLCRDELGLQIELLSGEEEAQLTYLGARSAIAATPGRVLVVDVGGGSMELAVGERATCDLVQSLPLGFLRLSRAFPASEPGSLLRLSHYVKLECEKARWQLGGFDSLVLSGGTARALAKLLGGGVLSASTKQIVSLCALISQTSSAGLQAMGVEATRSITLAAGAAVISGVLAGFGQRELRFSPRGLREGVLLRELSRRATTRAA
jgi:exopolyphosphatase / guanosine-5'-triphosphate,3'-diphosphate pyrophosphatase